MHPSVNSLTKYSSAYYIPDTLHCNMECVRKFPLWEKYEQIVILGCVVM
jgi:hypothetical protein